MSVSKVLVSVGWGVGITKQMTIGNKDDYII